MNGYKALNKNLPSRRKCGWGSTITTCNRCGKVMLGHNRGLCSKCLRADSMSAGGSIFRPEPSVGIRHLLAGSGSVKKRQTDGLRDIYAHGGQLDQTKGDAK